MPSLHRLLMSAEKNDMQLVMGAKNEILNAGRCTDMLKLLKWDGQHEHEAWKRNTLYKNVDNTQ